MCVHVALKPKNSIKAMGKQYGQTRKRIQKLEAMGKKVVYIWEHEWDKLVKQDPEAREVVDNFQFNSPLLPNEVFSGQIEAIRPHYSEDIDGGKAKNLDFMSLYPYVNKYTTYPIGHPEIRVGSMQARKVELSSCFGMVKVKVLPPRHLYLSVLPYKSCTFHYVTPAQNYIPVKSVIMKVQVPVRNLGNQRT